MNSSKYFHEHEQHTQSQSVLNAFDFSQINEMDPSMMEGHKIVYDREVPFELRIQDQNSTPQEVGTLEAIRAKVLVKGDGGSLEEIKVELTSENDLFFHYTHKVTVDSFRSMQEQQKLMVEFHDYHSILMKMLNQCIKEPHSYLAVFIMSSDGYAKLDFI